MSELKEVRVCLGRFQPFTAGHLKMVDYKCKGPVKCEGRRCIQDPDKLREKPDIDKINKQKTVIFVQKVPTEKIDANHPFDENIMKEEMDLIKSNPNVEDIIFVNGADICAWGAKLKEAGYKASVWITGSDHTIDYTDMVVKVPEYEEKDLKGCAGAYTKSFYLEVIERKENSTDFLETVSGTKVREALRNDDKEYFKKAMPKGTDKLFDKFKEALLNAPEPKQKKEKKKKNESLISLKNYIQENLK